jgi:DNA-binding MarR family transcriptional regulator
MGGSGRTGCLVTKPAVIKALQRVTITPRQVNMTDIKRSRPSAPVPARRAVGADSDVATSNTAIAVAAPHVDIVELLFFAYRDFTAAADELLAGYGLGRAHHRVLHFVHRNPGLRVADLLDLLRITKQSLARVLKQLIDNGWIVQRATAVDRRVRRLYTTPQGCRLVERLITVQSQRVGQSLPAADRAAVRQFLRDMVSVPHRSDVDRLIQGNAASDIEARPILDRQNVQGPDADRGPGRAALRQGRPPNVSNG